MRLGASLVAGVLTGLCFPPVGLGPVVLVALVPLLWAWRDACPAHAALYGFAYGIAAYVVVIPWIRYFGYVAIVPLVVAMALAIAGVGALVAAYGRRRLTSPFLTAAVWVVLEAVRGRFPFGGFPWADLGVALHDIPAARALAGVGGTLLVSFVVVAVNGLLLDLGLALRADTTRSALLAGLGVAAILVAAVVVDLTRFEPTTTGHLRVALLQGDDEQLPLAEQVNQPLTEKHFALADRLRGRYDLIVFPESALDTDPESDPQLRARLVALAEEHDASVLVNARTPGDDGQSRNTNLLYTPAGKLQGTYSKQHLVPFGEYVPWRDALELAAGAAAGALRLRTGCVAHAVPRGRPPVRIGDLLRIRVRAARARRGARRRAGRRREHQQPVVPAFREQRAAPRARPDARGRDRTVGAPGVGVGDQRGHRPRRFTAPRDRPVRVEDRHRVGADVDRRDVLRALR